MKYKNMPAAEPRKGDCKAMVEAIHSLLAKGVDVRRPPNSAYQLKVSDDLSFYPAKKTIFRDCDAAALPERGLEALVNLLESEGDWSAGRPSAAHRP